MFLAKLELYGFVISVEILVTGPESFPDEGLFVSQHRQISQIELRNF